MEKNSEISISQNGLPDCQLTPTLDNLPTPSTVVTTPGHTNRTSASRWQSVISRFLRPGHQITFSIPKCRCNSCSFSSRVWQGLRWSQTMQLSATISVPSPSTIRPPPSVRILGMTCRTREGKWSEAITLRAKSVSSSHRDLVMDGLPFRWESKMVCFKGVILTRRWTVLSVDFRGWTRLVSAYITAHFAVVDVGRECPE